MNGDGQGLEKLKRKVADFFVRNKIDYTIDFSILHAFLDDFRRMSMASASSVSTEWMRYFRETKTASDHIGVYVHIPFCVKKCFFCHCAMSVITGKDSVAGYVDNLVEEVKFFYPSWMGRLIQFLQVGGGTPSVLPSHQMEKLFGAIFSVFSVDPSAVRSVEFNPATTSLKKLQTAHTSGFNRVSFGVQSLNPIALKKENREYQSADMTRRAIDWAKAVGFEIVNVDLLLGLTSDDSDGFLESLRQTLDMKPDSITISGVISTDEYLGVMKINRTQHQRHHHQMVTRALEPARRLFDESRYRPYGLSCENTEWIAYKNNVSDFRVHQINHYYEDANIANLGLGYYARSFVPGVGSYERLPVPFDPAGLIYKKSSLNDKEEMMRYIIQKIKNDSRIELSPFKEKFGVDLKSIFGLELRVLKLLNKVKIKKTSVEFTPIYGPERIFYGSFFLVDIISRSPLSIRDWDRSWRELLEADLTGVSLDLYND